MNRTQVNIKLRKCFKIKMKPGELILNNGRAPMIKILYLGFNSLYCLFSSILNW